MADQQPVAVQEVPSLSSSAGSGQHSDPVWQVRWVDRGLEQEERLVTISTDGRVTQWATTKVISLTDAVVHTNELWICMVVAVALSPWPFCTGYKAHVDEREGGVSA